MLYTGLSRSALLHPGVAQGAGYSPLFIGVEATPFLMTKFQKDYPESLEKFGLQVWLVGTSLTSLTSDR